MNLCFYNRRNKMLICILLIFIMTLTLFMCSIQEAYALAQVVPIAFTGAAVIASILLAWGMTDSTALQNVSINLFDNASNSVKVLLIALAAKGVSSNNGIGTVNMGIDDYTVVSEYLKSKININIELNKEAGVLAPIVAAENPLSPAQMNIAISALSPEQFPSRLIIYEPLTDTRNVIGLTTKFLKATEPPYTLPLNGDNFGCSMRIYMSTDAKMISFKGNETSYTTKSQGSKYFNFINMISTGNITYYRQEALIVAMIGGFEGIVAENNITMNNWGYEGCYVPKGTKLNTHLSCDIKPESFSGTNTGTGASYYVDKTSISTNNDGSISVSIPYATNPSFDGEDTNIAVPIGNSIDNPITLETVIKGYESIDGFFEAGGSIILADGTVITKTDVLAQTGATEGATSATGDIPIGTTWPYTIPILGDILKILSKILEAIQNFFDISELKLDFEPLKIGITKKFPFCIPFDLLRLVETFSQQPEDFKFRIYLKTSFFSIDHIVDLSPFKIPIRFFRWICVIYFSWILISRTRDLMKW